MLPILNDFSTSLDSYDLAFIAGSPTVYHSHHFNLFFDQIIDDALGSELGTRVRTKAAYESSLQFLRSIFEELPPTTSTERLRIASAIFASMGQGRLSLQGSQLGGREVGHTLHHGFSWQEKYGAGARRSHGADAFAAGFIAAATETAYGLPGGSLECRERACVAMGAPECSFEVTRTGTTYRPRTISERDIADAVPRELDGLFEDRIRKMARAVRGFAGRVSCDERGLISAFGILVTHHLANYYNQCTARTLEITRREKSEALPALEDLFREAGMVGGVNTIGGILVSDEWSDLMAVQTGDPLEFITGGLAIARALGFGHWALEWYEPKKLLVIRAPATYESVYRRALSENGSPACACYLFQGVSLALMQLAHPLSLGQKLALMDGIRVRSSERRHWEVSESHCVARGDPLCRAVVQRHYPLLVGAPLLADR